MSKKSLFNNTQEIFIESQNIIKKFGNTQVLKDLNLTIYPNPAYDILTIENKNRKDFTMSFTDLLTKNVIFNEQIVANTTKTIDITNLAPGNYLIIFKTGKNQIISKKFIKQ